MFARYFRRWSSGWLGIAAAAIAVGAGEAIVTPLAMAGPALVFEAAEGKVLYAEDQDVQWSPASLTKIMTAYLVFDAIKKGALTPAGARLAARVVGVARRAIDPTSRADRRPCPRLAQAL